MALRVIADFEHAAVEKVRIVEAERRVYFAAPLGDSPRGMWFHFKVEGGDGSLVTFVLVNRDHMLGASGYRRAVPVYRVGDGPWRRVDPASCQADEPGQVESFVDGPRPVKHFFLFQAACGPAVTEIAYCFPYTRQMIDQACARWGRNRNVTVMTVGVSEGGRPLRVVRIGAPARGKKVIWVLARQHAGEVPGSYAAEGIVDAALSGAAWAASLRRRAVLYVCPAVDIDGVSEGMYGKDREPVDFNRCWSAHPRRREVAGLCKAMDLSRRRCARSSREQAMLVNLDLHAPGPNAVSFPVPPHPAWAGRLAWQRAWWFAKLLERFSTDSAPVRWANSYPDHIDWSSPALGPMVCTTFHAASGLALVAMSLELTYNWQVNNTLVTPDDWRRIGLAVAKALESAARSVDPPGRVCPPDPPNYLSPFWGWMNMPRECNGRVNEDIVSIQADGAQGYAALLFSEPIPIGRGRFEAQASIARTSRGKCSLARLIYFVKDGLLTGEVAEQKGELSSDPLLKWRAPSRRRFPADAARLGVVLRNWPGTITIGRPVRV